MKADDRCCGVLLHPTSLPGNFGIGEIGPQLHDFIDAMAASGVRRWQVLPLGPTGYAASPYTSPSTFAANPLMISVERLLEEGWLTSDDIHAPAPGEDTRIDFDEIEQWKDMVLRSCYARFQKDGDERVHSWFDGFCKANAEWLDDYALFQSLKVENNDLPWNEWAVPLVRREKEAIDTAKDRLAFEIDFVKFCQFLFDRQWEGVRNHCREKNIQIIGDLPIFVAYDSSDVWTHQDMFQLDSKGNPEAVAGVPPDYFCETGQLWGNPLYDWAAHEEESFGWWLNRLKGAFNRYDIVRIDHFRGLRAYWRVPADEETAINGEWVEAPGDKLLKAVQFQFAGLPVIAEDLGVITPDVDKLRTDFGLPGMRVLQFAFGPEDPKTATHAPHNHTKDLVVYTGTHDNDTTRGWFHGEDNSADIRPPERRELERKNCLSYMGSFSSDGIHWQMIRLCLSSVADTAIIPVQDILGLGSDARMNRPGLVRDDNWSWRLTQKQMDELSSEAITNNLKELIVRYGRE